MTNKSLLITTFVLALTGSQAVMALSSTSSATQSNLPSARTGAASGAAGVQVNTTAGVSAVQRMRAAPGNPLKYTTTSSNQLLTRLMSAAGDNGLTPQEVKIKREILAAIAPGGDPEADALRVQGALTLGTVQPNVMDPVAVKTAEMFTEIMENVGQFPKETEEGGVKKPNPAYTRGIQFGKFAVMYASSNIRPEVAIRRAEVALETEVRKEPGQQNYDFNPEDANTLCPRK